MRGIDVLLAFPAFVLALALTTSFGFGLFSMTAAIGISYTPNFARIARGSVLTVREEEFVEAARSIGLKDLNIMVFEILPNCLAPIIVQATIAIGFAIIMESGLSFLGVGIQPPGFSWGTMLADGREYLARAPWIVTFAGVVITLAVLGMNLLGDGLRDTLDARLKTEVRNT
jgi:peptide/nickel transport system permease protein